LLFLKNLDGTWGKKIEKELKKGRVGRNFPPPAVRHLGEGRGKVGANTEGVGSLTFSLLKFSLQLIPLCVFFTPKKELKRALKL
jgi:hypothetical protein